MQKPEEQGQILPRAAERGTGSSTQRELEPLHGQLQGGGTATQASPGERWQPCRNTAAPGSPARSAGAARSKQHHSARKMGVTGAAARWYRLPCSWQAD